MAKENKAEIQANIRALDIEKDSAESTEAKPAKVDGLQSDEMYIYGFEMIGGNKCPRKRTCKIADLAYFKSKGFSDKE